MSGLSQRCAPDSSKFWRENSRATDKPHLHSGHAVHAGQARRTPQPPESPVLCMCAGSLPQFPRDSESGSSLFFLFPRKSTYLEVQSSLFGFRHVRAYAPVLVAFSWLTVRVGTRNQPPFLVVPSDRAMSSAAVPRRMRDLREVRDVGTTTGYSHVSSSDYLDVCSSTSPVQG